MYSLQFFNTCLSHRQFLSIIALPPFLSLLISQLTASDFYSSPCFFYLSPPATICLYPTLAWHHLLQEAPYLPHPQSLHQPIHPSYNHQPYLLTRKFEIVICLFRKL